MGVRLDKGGRNEGGQGVEGWGGWKGKDSVTILKKSISISFIFLLRHLIQAEMVFIPFRTMQILLREMAFIGLGDSRGYIKVLGGCFKAPGLILLYNLVKLEGENVRNQKSFSCS